MHVHEPLNELRPVKVKRKQSEGERQMMLRGIDERKPVRRGKAAEDLHQVNLSAMSSGTPERAFFKHDSVFARRFPHLMRREEAVTSLCLDGFPDQRG